MSRIIDSCAHRNELIDQREGDIVCSDCGLVVDRYYQSSEMQRDFMICNIPKKYADFVFEVVERLNMPNYISFFIFEEISENLHKTKISESFLSNCIYKKLNELGMPFSIKDICGATGISSNKISENKKLKKEKNRIVFVDSKEILERTCSKLNIDYKNYTLIKESIKQLNNGFSPSTVVASYIHIFCKKNKLPITLKEICSNTGVSCVSVQRFIKKNALS